MRKINRRIPETLALILCICLLFIAWMPVNAQAYLVQPGDSLWKLSRYFGVAIHDIQAANSIDSDLILAGETLEIPEEKPEEEIEEENEKMTVSKKDMELLARAVYSEARGEPFQGQVAIAAVILNRVEHPDFPDTISGVIYQPWAFTAVHDGQFWLTPNGTAYAAVEAALAGEDPSKGAIFYYNPVTATNRWIRSRPIITTIGKHVFAL